MWEIVPDERYAANPAKGSGHNRGIAVDVTLVNLLTGKELAMPTDFDDFSEKAHHDYMHLDSTIIANRKILRDVMEQHGFVALQTEWWHYSLPDPKKYQLMDLDFDQLRRLTGNF
jgi:D-alanyl-D-alanine dipeptidase